MEFKEYPSIENSYRIKTINDIIQYGLSYGEWVVTEKVHGSNFSFWMNREGIRYAKRTTFLREDDNFYGWERVADLYYDRLKQLYIAVGEVFNLKIESYEIALFGEIFGGNYPHPSIERDTKSTTVQKGVYYSPKNDFYAFDLKVQGRFVNYDIFEGCMKELGFLYAKALYRGFFQDSIAYPNEFPTTIPNVLGLPPIENNICEGVVIKPVIDRIFPCGSRVILKNKNEKFSENLSKDKTSLKQTKVASALSPEEQEILDLVDSYINENRLRSVLSKVGQVTDKMFGKLLGMFSQDVISDLRKDHEEKFSKFDVSQNKTINKRINMVVSTFIRDRFLNIIDGTF